MAKKQHGFSRVRTGTTIVKRVINGQVKHDYYPNRQVAQSWVDVYNHQNPSSQAVIIDVIRDDNPPRDHDLDDTVRS